MPLFKFACPHCGASLPIPVGSFSKCRYCGMTVTLQQGDDAAREKDQKLIKTLSSYPNLEAPYEKLLSSYYSKTFDAKSIIHNGMTTARKLIFQYEKYRNDYELRVEPLTELMEDLLYIVSNALFDVSSLDNIKAKDLDDFLAELITIVTMISPMRKSVPLILYQPRASIALQRIEPHFPEQAKLYKGFQSELAFSDASIQVMNNLMPLKPMSEPTDEEIYGLLRIDYGNKKPYGCVLRQGFLGFLPTISFLVRFLYYPINIEEGSSPSKIRSEFFVSRSKVIKHFLELMYSLIDLKRNWIRPAKANDIAEFLSMNTLVFCPYEYKKGFMKSTIDVGLREIQNALNELGKKFTEVQTQEPLKQATLDL